jgi:hypothetical protein
MSAEHSGGGGDAADGKVGGTGSQRQRQPAGYQAQVADGAEDGVEVWVMDGGDEGLADKRDRDEKKDALPYQVRGQTVPGCRCGRRRGLGYARRSAVSP